MSLSKNPLKRLNSNQLSIKPVYYGMKNKVSNDDQHLSDGKATLGVEINKLKLNISTTKKIRINAQQLQDKMDERPLTGQFSLLVKKKLDSNSAVRYRNQGLADGAGAYASGMNLYAYDKAEKRIGRNIDKQERDEKKILKEDINKNLNMVVDRVI